MHRAVSCRQITESGGKISIIVRCLHNHNWYTSLAQSYDEEITALADTEFNLIDRYFSALSPPRHDVVLGIGDDCALLKPTPDKLLAVSMDTLVSGVHFLPDTDPVALGHKALAVNLSDLAAMGAAPAWVSLALTLPQVDETWLAGFCEGFGALARQHGVQLIGGDTTHGPLAITVQVQGWVEPAHALCRSGAQVGDAIFVTGTPGDAALGLALLQQDPKQASLCAAAEPFRADLCRRLERPTARIAQGLDLAGLAHAAIDVSDGLAQDLGHILQQSGVGADLWVERLPLSAALNSLPQRTDALALALGGGDDYELCFTVPPAQCAELKRRAAAWDCACTEIGRIRAEPGLRCLWDDGSPFLLESAGYEHFR